MRRVVRALVIVALATGCTTGRPVVGHPDRVEPEQEEYAPSLAGVPSLLPSSTITVDETAPRPPPTVVPVLDGDDDALLRQLRGALRVDVTKSPGRCEGVVLEVVEVSPAFAPDNVLDERSRVVLRVENKTGSHLGLPGSDRFAIAVANGTVFRSQSSPDPFLWFQPVDVAPAATVQLTVLMDPGLTKGEVAQVLVHGVSSSGADCEVRAHPASGSG